MNPTTQPDTIELPTKEDIIRIYRGRPGCGCGCRGTYYEGDELTSRRVAGALRSLRDGIDQDQVEVDQMSDGQTCISRQTDSSYLWVYTKAVA